MAVTIVVRSADEPDSPELSLTLDAPRIVLGRGEGCEVRLPDPSVSHRHASLRQRGGEWVLVDENSLNGTLHERVRLPPQTPRAIKSGELVRLGRVWLELRIEPVLVKGSMAAAAKEMAMALVARGLRAQGEDPDARLTIVSGPEAGRSLPLPETGRSYVIGRSKDVDFPLEDLNVARRHAAVTRKGDTLILQDLGSPAGIYLEGAHVATEATWRIGQVARVGPVELRYEYPAAEATAEIERSPDERMKPGDAAEPPSRHEPTPTPTPAFASDTDLPGPLDVTPTPTPVGALPVAARKAKLAAAKKESGGWGITDGAVAMVALGVLVLSVLGVIWVLGR